ncbi:hypothetical protein G6F31_019825 [Rhizopus arrhizus]|nr:hypothetical protein G6F31_019825 [Rhizopus arrhizus]
MRCSGLALSLSARATTPSTFLSVTVMISRELRASFTSVGLADSTSAVSRSPLSLNLSNTPSRNSSRAAGLFSVPAGRSSCSSGPG